MEARDLKLDDICETYDGDGDLGEYRIIHLKNPQEITGEIVGRSIVDFSLIGERADEEIADADHSVYTFIELDRKVDLKMSAILKYNAQGKYDSDKIIVFIDDWVSFKVNGEEKYAMIVSIEDCYNGKKIHLNYGGDITDYSEVDKNTDVIKFAEECWVG